MCYNSYEKARKKVFQPVFNALITRISLKKQKWKAESKKKRKEKTKKFLIAGEKPERTREKKTDGARKKVGL